MKIITFVGTGEDTSAVVSLWGGMQDAANMANKLFEEWTGREGIESYQITTSQSSVRDRDAFYKIIHWYSISAVYEEIMELQG